MPPSAQENGPGASSESAPASTWTNSIVADLIPAHTSQDIHHQDQTDDDDNTVYLSLPLWDRIAPPHKQSAHRDPVSDTRIAVTITPAPSSAAAGGGAARSNSKNKAKVDDPQAITLPSIIAWARLRASAPSDTSAQNLTITFPPSFAQHVPPPNQNRRQTATIAPYFPPLPLSSIYLAALDSAAFEYANAQDGGDGSSLHSQLTGRIVRQGETLLVFPNNDDPSTKLPYRVIMTEPILQGVVKEASSSVSPSASPNPNVTPSEQDQTETEIMVLLHPDASSVEEDGDTSVLSSSASSTSSDDVSHQQPNGTHPVDQQGGVEDDFDLSIDEDFLGRSVLHGYSIPNPAQSNTAAHARLEKQHDRKNIFDPALLGSQAPIHEAIAEWRRTQQNSASAGETSDVGAAVEEESIDDHCVVLLPERTFAQLGCFNGDWAIIKLKSENITRIVRLFAHPSPLPRSSSKERRKTVYMSPLLHQNLHRQHTFDPMRSASVAVLLPLDSRQRSVSADGTKSEQKWPLGPSCPLPIPFAESLTISRLASPLALDRAYQPLFLDALRTYFQPPSDDGRRARTRRRIVKEGQVIAVGIHKGRVRFTREARGNAVVAGGGEDGSGGNGEKGEGKEGEGDDSLDDLMDESSSHPPTGIVYFRITALAPESSEPEPLPPPSAQSISIGMGIGNGSVDDSDSTAATWAEMQILIRDRARRGEYGCVVDPEFTKMVQTGLENGRVGDLGAYLGIASESPACPQSGALPPTSSSTEEENPSFPTTALTAPSTSPFDRLVHLVQATLLPRTQDFGLHLSVLIKGARGSGKKTICRWVAQRCGVHLLELNCYDLLSDTDARTEGVLRARFEKAASCGPAILLLQNIEALARKSQALESGQEPLLAGVLADCIKGLRRAGERRRRRKLKSAKAEKGDEERDEKDVAASGNEGKDEDDEEEDVEVPQPIAVFATTSDPDKCPTSVLGCFKHEVAISAPNEAERLEILQTAVKGTAIYPDVSLKSMATQTAALVAADLVDLVGRAKLAAMARLQKHFGEHAWSVANAAAAGIALSGADFEVALNKARASYSESIGAPKIPNVTWDDVGGLASVKNDILDTIQLPLEHPELFSDGLKKRSGILLYGPPGTGKTLLAKAVATSCSLNFFSVKGPELLNMYIGESEANVRRVFQRARDAKPCVIFFDELDSVAPKRGNQGDSGGVMDRIVSQLLAELDGMTGGGEGSDVFVIGATNRPDLLDPALLRPGRFDRMLYLSVSETHDAQLNILQALTRKFKLDPDLGDLSVIADQCPFNLTGADFYALCSDAMLKAMTRKAGEVDKKLEKINAEHPLNPRNVSVKALAPALNGLSLSEDSEQPQDQEQAQAPYPHPYPITPQYYLAELAQPSEIEVRVSRVDFEAALRELVPSVSEQEMEHYRAVQSKFSSPDDGKKSNKGAGEVMGVTKGEGSGKGKGKGKAVAAIENGPAVPLGVGDGVLMPPQVAEDVPLPSNSKGKGKGKGKA
ncbi:hypothetical protein CF326_g1733 [Tilletia indica]|nr:hypothetical protein CF326_g1733 [Tilletia indica]